MNLNLSLTTLRDHGDAVVSTALVLSRYSSFIQQSKNMHFNWLSDSKLALGLKLCLSPCVTLWQIGDQSLQWFSKQRGDQGDLSISTQCMWYTQIFIKNTFIFHTWSHPVWHPFGWFYFLFYFIYCLWIFLDCVSFFLGLYTFNVQHFVNLCCFTCDK